MPTRRTLRSAPGIAAAALTGLLALAVVGGCTAGPPTEASRTVMSQASGRDGTTQPTVRARISVAGPSLLATPRLVITGESVHVVMTAPPSPPWPHGAGPAIPSTAPPAPHATAAPSPTASRTVATPRFHSSIVRIDPALAARMRTTYHAGCPVPLTDLRYLRLSYWGFDGTPHTGEMVVSARVARDVVTAFRSLYTHRFPIRQMRLVDDFAGSDDDSMAADNTSAFNCRPVTGGAGWSQHSYGEAIDINPVENPYLSGAIVLPPAGRAYLSRPDRPGVIHAGDAAVRAFAAIGWTWGGTWSTPVDLQHFSRSGR